jgi:hypothetical protein
MKKHPKSTKPVNCGKKQPIMPIRQVLDADNPFSSPQNYFEKMRKMFYLCSALVENGLPFSFAGFQISHKSWRPFLFLRLTLFRSSESLKKIALVEIPEYKPIAGWH